MPVQDTAVHKSVIVHTSQAKAFRLFTEGFDSWWPRTHHIGSGALTKAVIEPRLGGRCYGEEGDGTQCDWGQVTVWEPPHRLVLAWRIRPSVPKWEFEPDLSKASEVEIRFTPDADGRTRVDLEHRHFERHGDGFEAMRAAVDSEGGWGGLLQMFVAKAEQSA